LKAKGQLVTVVNAGKERDLAAGGLARLDQSVAGGTDAVILELGANDMVYGIQPDVTRTALAAILQKLRSRRIPVLLCGAQPHTILDDVHKKAFAAMFSGLASEYNLLFDPAFDDAFVDDDQLRWNGSWTLWRACSIIAPRSLIAPQHPSKSGGYRSDRYANIAASRGVDRTSAPQRPTNPCLFAPRSLIAPQ
jgi:GDSL-like lipase/acylhydrolase family protein